MKHFLFPLVLFFVALAAVAQERDEACKFKEFYYEAEVHADNSWSIRETITANFLEPRHGIFQYIELYYNDWFDNDCYKYATKVKDVHVAHHKYKESYEDSAKFKVIRIGDEDVTVSGEVVYDISYTLQYPDDRYAKADILYTTILGAQWKNDIDEFTFKIHFEKPLPADFEQRLKLVSGGLGSEVNALKVDYKVDRDNNSIVGSASGVAHHNAITLRAQLPEGYWATDSTGHDRGSMAIALLYASLALFILTLVYIIAGRRRKPLVSVEYSAPEGISSAEVGFIIDNTADLLDLTSLIVWWASKGYIKIEENEEESRVLGVFKKKKTTITLHEIAPLPDQAPAYQHMFWNVLFHDNAKVCRLSDIGDKSSEIKQALSALKENYTGADKLVALNRNAVLMVMAYLLCASLAILLSSRVEAFSVDNMAIVLPWVASVLGFGSWFFRYSEKGLKGFLSEKRVKRIFALVMMAFICWITLDMASELYDPINNVLPQYGAAALVAGGWIFLLFVRHLRKDTPRRLELMSRLLGFKEFIRAAEVPMLKAMVDENPSYFYDVLPYAIVFGLSDKWCEQFEGLDIQQPDWYVTTSADPLHHTSGLLMARDLTNVFNSEIVSSIRSSSIPPSSDFFSGDGGGGFSGGGGGGGGGGSW